MDSGCVGRSGDDRKVVTLEIPESWFSNPEDGHRHRLFYSSVLAALAELKVLIDPVWLPRGAERAPRPGPGENFTISFHSYGSASGNVLRCKESYIPPYYSLDPMGYACFSQLAARPDLYRQAIARQDPVRAADFIRQLSQDLIRSNRSKYAQPDPGKQLAEPYVFIPLQVQNDTVSEGNWLDPEEAVPAIVEAAAARGLKTVVKRHPRCRSAGVARFLDRLAQQDQVVISTGSVHSLILGAELVVGANSGVLFEALIHGKPVISHATSDFGMATQQVRDRDALIRAMITPEVPDSEWRNRFLFWYLTEYCVQAGDFPAIRRRILEAMTGVGVETGRRRRRPAYIGKLYIYSLADRIKRRIF